MENQVATANLSESDVLFLIQTLVNQNEGKLKTDGLKLMKIKIHVSEKDFEAGKKYKVWLVPGLDENGNNVSYIAGVEKDAFAAPKDHHFTIIREYNPGDEVKINGEAMKVLLDEDGLKKLG